MDFFEYLKNNSSSFRKEGREVWTGIDKTDFFDVLERVRDEGIHRVVSISGLDAGSEYQVIYSFAYEGMLINLILSLPKAKPEIKTITGIFPGAHLYERELMEMFGIQVKGHPYPERLFLSETSPETPLRKSD